MKANISHIIAEHIKSLNDSPTLVGKMLDSAVIYAVPLVSGILASIACITIDKNFYGISISVFAVFSALLLNTQIAIFGIYGREVQPYENQKEQEAKKVRDKVKAELISELNTNISYLMIFSVISLFLSCAMFIFDLPAQAETFVTFSIYVHFSVVVVIVIKRAHALFYNEYTSTS